MHTPESHVAEAARFTRGTSEFDRALSFIDAIFGFSITLLIANLDMPRRKRGARSAIC
ncbi:hypothetical protein [Mycolicibacterium thermoresistibile]